MNGDGISDLVVSAVNYNNQAGRVYVVFGDVSPVLVNNSLFLINGETIALTAFNLAAYDRNHDNSTLVFMLSNVIHGQFELVSNPWMST